MIQTVTCKCGKVIAASVYPVQNDPEWEVQIEKYRSEGKTIKVQESERMKFMGPCVCPNPVEILDKLINMAEGRYADLTRSWGQWRDQETDIQRDETNFWLEQFKAMKGKLS